LSGGSDNGQSGALGEGSAVRIEVTWLTTLAATVAWLQRQV
jgi:hypothetical protein